MRKLLYLLLLVSFNTLNAQTAYPTGISGCIARWNFTNPGTVTSVPDVSANGNNGTPNNLVTAIGFRTINNKAMRFNGTSSYALVSHANILTPSKMTIVALVKLYGFYSGLCEGNQIISKGSPYYIPGHYGMNVFDNVYDGTCGIFSPTKEQLGSEFSNAPQVLTAGNYVQTGKWYFFAVSYDGDTTKYYQREMDTATYYATIPPISKQTGLATAIGTNTQNLTIGRHNDGNYPYWFNGDMDEVILFNRVLSDSEVQNVYHYLWGDIFINTTDTVLCPSAQMTINYTIHNPEHFLPGNTFTAQLSDATGNFTTPITIGSVTSTTSGSISCTIPSGITAGSGYRVRVISSDKHLVSADNGKNILIATSLLLPSVSITVTPMGTLAYGTSVTYTAAPVYGGSSPKYKWYKNSFAIPGATSSTYTAIAGIDFVTSDSIYVEMISGSPCAASDAVRSNKIGMKVLPNSINGVFAGNNFVVYPNPNKGTFVLKGYTFTNTAVQLNITNALGQTVYSDVITPNKYKLENTIELQNASNGIYILHLNSEVVNSTLRFMVN
jgi:hypothetical protein